MGICAVQQKQINYNKFIFSPAWVEKKRLFRLTRDWPICFKCGAWDVPMDVHHLTYARFGGDELMEDLEYVCRPCHNEIHGHKYKRKRHKIKKQSSKSKRKRDKRKQNQEQHLKNVARHLEQTLPKF